MSRERRRSVRRRKRLRTSFGVSELEHSGYTGDISLGGIFLITARLQTVGTRLHLHILTKDDSFFAEGQVVRVKNVPVPLRRLEQQGMGIRFLTPAEVINQLIPLSRRSPDLLAVHCKTPEQLKHFLSEQLGSGILVVPAGDPAPALNAFIKFEIRVGFIEHEPIHGHGRVVQHLKSMGATQGNIRVVVEVQDAASLCATLNAMLDG